MSDDDEVQRALDPALGPDEFARFVLRSQSIACAVAYSALGDRALSEDVVQEAFLIAWRALPSRRDQAAVPAWLCGIVRRVAANVRRKRRWEVTTMDIAPQLPAPGPSALDELVTREEERLAARALAVLADRYREPLVLFYRGDQSVKEVAAALSLSEDAVKQRLSRGRKLLEQQLPMVERVLRATRPGPAFTAAAVAAFVASRSTAAAASTPPASGVTAGKLALVAVLALPIVVGVVAATAGSGKRDVAAPRAPATAAASSHEATTVAHTAGSGRSRPGGARAADDTSAAVAPRAASAAPGWRAAFERRIDLDFGQADSYDMIRLISDATGVPILVKGDIGARVNLRLTDVTALAALDEILAQAGAKRSESSGLRVVRSTPTPAPLDGGEPFSADFADAELPDVLRALAPKLGMAVVVAGDVPPTRVTIELDNVAAGAALAAILTRADLAVERVAALEVTPDTP